MILSNTDGVCGMETTETLGLVSGSTVRARVFIRDFLAGLKNFFGGEVTTYTRMLEDAREQAVVRMIEAAEKKGADAVIQVRFSTSAIMRNAAEVLAYGTAVKLGPAGGADARPVRPDLQRDGPTGDRRGYSDA